MYLSGVDVADQITFWSFHATDASIVLATIVGPIAAVQAQKWIERGRVVRDRRLGIFRTLMATRAARLSQAHVEALNAIPVEFYGKNPKLKAITDDWHSLMDEFANLTIAPQIAAVRRMDAFLNMLHKMSTYLGYSFNRSQLEKDVYYPTGHANIENDQEVIRRGFAQLLKGEISIPMAVKEFPYDQDAVVKQEALRKLMVEWLAGERAVKVEQP